MKVLIAYAGGDAVHKVAGVIAEGAKEVNVEVTLAALGKAKPEGEFDFVFLGGFLSKPLDSSLKKFLDELRGKNVALFFVSPKPDKQALDAALAEASQKGVSVKNTFTASLSGFFSFLGFGSVKEEDLIRARGFGERTLNNFFNLPFGEENEKARIRGYLK